jgi:selenocysteine lyase/cysteine desulfurase
VVIRSDALPKRAPFQTGGGTTKIVSRRSVVWEDAPDRFEAGTPPVINAVAFARALELNRRFGTGVFEPRRPAATAPSEILHRDELLEFSGRELLQRLRGAVMGRGHLVPAAGGFLPYIHLDNAASTPACVPVWKAVCQAWRLPEDQQAELVAIARAMSAGFFGAPAAGYDLIFTSNTTEAINIATKALTWEPDAGRVPEYEPVVLNTFLEHNSNELPWRFAKGVTLIRTPIDDEGFPDLSEMERRLREYNRDQAHGRKRIRIVAVSGASNVLGTCPDLGEISRLAHRYQALVFVDAAQLAGHRAIRAEADHLDGLAFSGHKMYAPFGTGGLILKKGLWPAGSEAFEGIRRSGDENVVGIAALGKAIDLLQRVGMDIVQEEELSLTRKALQVLATVPSLELYGIRDPDSPRINQRLGVISFGLKQTPHNLAAERLAETAAIGARTGCFCAHILVKRLLHIHPLREAVAHLGLKLAPGVTKALLPGLVRISFGLENDEADVRRLVMALKRIAGERPSLAARLLAKTHNAVPFVPETDTRRRMRAAMERATSSFFQTSAEAKGDRPQRPASSGRHPFKGMIFLGQPCCRKS